VDLPNDRQLAIETDPLDEDYSELLPETLTPRTATESDDSCSEDEMSSDDDLSSDDDTCQPASTNDDDNFATALLLFILAWQFVYKVSNVGVTVLLHFLKLLIHSLGSAYGDHPFSNVSEKLPLSLKKAHAMCQILSSDGAPFEVYCVCKSCQSIFEKGFWIESDSLISCPYVPPLPTRIGRPLTPCGEMLLKKIASKDKFAPAKIFCYQSLKIAFQNFAERGILDECEHWRMRNQCLNVFSDVYDGNIWKNKFKDFLSAPYSLLVSLNIDWFQPFKHLTYSVGAIYLSIFNLPRHLRNRIESIILVGIIPGPKEPKLTLNSYLTPLVTELKNVFTQGFKVVNSNGQTLTIRVALGCVNCDIPASRRVCGFLAHSANLGCNKCYKKFYPVPNAERANYSGFDRENWELRTNEKHRRDCKNLEQAKTVNSLRAKESQLGARNSVLLSLPYFDPIQFCVIDPMHNLFMGTAKTMMKVWLDKGVLTFRKMAEIEKKMQMFRIPGEVGRLPCNLANFSGFTANQWKYWITVYSSIVLKGVVPEPDYNCWLLFVRACSLLLHGSLVKEMIDLADEFLSLFCSRFEQLYGEESCTCNLHLHLHLRDCILDYGPPHVFWCFSFERYNGILTTYHTNNRDIEKQLMKRFLEEQKLRSVITHANGQRSQRSVNAEFMSLLPATNESNVYTWDNFYSYLNRPSLKEKSLQELLVNEEMFQVSWAQPPYVSVPPKKVADAILTADQARSLSMFYQVFYSNTLNVSFLPLTYKKVKSILYAGDKLGSCLSARSSSVVCAYWPGSIESVQISNFSANNILRVGQIQYFLQHTVETTSNSESGPQQISHRHHLWAYIIWKKLHPFLHYFGLDSVASAVEDEQPTAACLIPVSFIHSRCAYIEHVEVPQDVEQSKRLHVAVPVPFQMAA
jgi:hypothetical protein